MSFVTTRPEALLAAAAALEGLGASMAGQNAAAAMPTTAVAPAAADEVSALQAAQFSAYGTWYQRVSAQSAAIHQMLVNTLGTSAGSYAETEAANQVATSAAPLATVTSGLPGTSGLSSTSDAIIGTPIGWAQNFPAAASDFFALAPGLAAPSSGPAEGAALAGDVNAAAPTGAATPVGATAVGATTSGAAVLATSGQAPSIGRLSVPPSWVTGGSAAATSAPVTLTGEGWTNAAPQPSQVTAMPAGVPSVASARRGGYGMGMPRYGEKPKVMPKPTVV